MWPEAMVIPLSRLWDKWRLLESGTLIHSVVGLLQGFASMRSYPGVDLDRQLSEMLITVRKNAISLFGSEHEIWRLGQLSDACQ